MVVRTTLQTMNQKILTNLNSLTSEMNRLNESISSQRQMSKPSDNPVHMVSALGLRSNLAEIKQYQDNLTFGSSIIDASENSLRQMKDLLSRAKVLASNAINGAVDNANRLNMAEEIKNLHAEAVTLANTQINNKYIFAGYRTAGYDDIEPTPFINDMADGYRLTGGTATTINGALTGTVDGTAIAAGDLEINGTALTTAVNASGGAVSGLYMDSAADIVAAVNTENATTGVSATLTTLYAGGNATNNGGVDSAVSFDLNGATVSFTVPASALAADVAAATVTAVNLVSDQTGVRAAVGTGANGGASNSVVLSNARAGDNTNIVLAGVSAAENTLIGLTDGTYVADATHNTGQVALTSAATFVISSPNNTTDDTVLAALGLDGGRVGFLDEPDDGQLVYGPRLGDGALKINGEPVGAPVVDGYSTIYADASAEAKANAINAVSDTTGVTAVITPVYRLAEGVVEAGTLNSGDLVINGVDILDSATVVLSQDSDNTLLDALNDKSGQTGFVASRDSEGRILLTPVNPTDSGAGLGRNLHIRTSVNGESLTHLNGGSTSADKVYFGSLQLRSDRKFMLQTTPSATGTYEPGLAALDLDGGQLGSGQPGDLTGDGIISVDTIVAQTGNVRYAGDRDNDIAMKVGRRSTLDISKNGQSAIMDSAVFDTLKTLENYLRGSRYSTVTGIQQATDTTAVLSSGDSGLALSSQITAGTFTVTVTDHAVTPATDFAMRIAVDPDVDTPAGIAAKINGVPGVTSSWSNDGYLQVAAGDSERYSISLTEHTSNFLEVAGITQEDMQAQGIEQSLADIDDSFAQLNTQVADFGARANRIVVQQQIYDNLELSTADNLSEMQDTDIVEALMQFQSKQIAYQAALSAASRTMQLSLVDFL